MQEIARKYEEPVSLILGSHSALDAASGSRNFGFKRIIYTTRERACIYLQNPITGVEFKKNMEIPELTRKEVIVRFDPADIPKNGGWRQCILILDSYDEILKYLDEMVELECIQIPNRAFSVYVGGEACRKIENDFYLPIVGSRKLLKIENREEVEKNYYWLLEKAGIPHPTEHRFKLTRNGITFPENIGTPLVLKVPFKHRRLERGFIFAANSSDMEEKVEKALKEEIISFEDLEKGRIEEYVPGVTANFNFFFSPLSAAKDWGETEDAMMKIYGISRERARKWLANELLSIDERREATHDGVLRLTADVQLKVNWSETPYPPTFEVTSHLSMSLRESLIRKIHPIANKFIEIVEEEYPPGMIGAYCIQTLITFKQLKKSDPDFEWITQVGHGLYDILDEEKLFDHVPKVQDVATRHGGGTNIHMGTGAPYSNVKYGGILSMGDRIALEMRRAVEKKELEKIVT